MSHPACHNSPMSPDALSGFHPAVAGWFRSRFPAPTEAQAPRLGGHVPAPQCPDRRADRLRQDARRVPLRNQ